MNPNPNPNPNPPSPPLICSNCKSATQLILHNIILTPKSPPSKLCTSCVLSHYHKSICAQCFEPYDVNSLTPPPLFTAGVATIGNNRLLPCMRCENWSHFGCPRGNTPKSPYICPPCMSANFKYFDFAKRRKLGQNQENYSGEKKSCFTVIDKEASKQLLGAAKIASITLAKALAAARGEAERRAKDAALSRKRASEAIDRVLEIDVKPENVKKKETSGIKPGNHVVAKIDRNGGKTASDMEIKPNVNALKGNGAIEAVPVAVSVAMPQQNDKNGGEKKSNNAVNPQSK